MTALECVEAVLRQAGKPLHYREITKRMLDQGSWQTTGKTPWESVNARLAMDILRQGANSPFQRTTKGVFALRAWGLPEYTVPGKGNIGANLKVVQVKATGSTDTASYIHTADSTAPVASMSFADATEHVLRQFGNGKPMHYRAIAETALQYGYIATTGQTPEATLYTAVLTAIARDTRRGETPRFLKHGKGFFGLGVWRRPGLAAQIETHNREVRVQLLGRLKAMPPAGFERLIEVVLGAIGFEEISKTSYSNDGGIDVRGTMVVGGVVRTTMAVQAKRWKNNVQAPIVQQVRGSLGTHEQGLIITTSDFSAGAKAEAARTTAVPVALMNGEQLVALMIEHDIGVTREPYHLLSLAVAVETGDAEALVAGTALDDD